MLADRLREGMPVIRPRCGERSGAPPSVVVVAAGDRGDSNRAASR
ncbi:MAG: hypothetical protein AVDCRST_MAG11-759 [uncultured Gemmatimonadaceae bacterium]|uniref:Uncharacterized protein n=1 Tax=uncultured Gemmatimonadaceae bacterium TaxID=246130 RepID=A0A6J4KA01_9BACT|nr:MAG: hypothetical protein AVDCRST_MAG11-759 [uncultured Gemmatimonadaceae bacterium]